MEMTPVTIGFPAHLLITKPYGEQYMIRLISVLLLLCAADNISATNIFGISASSF